MAKSLSGGIWYLGEVIRGDIEKTLRVALCLFVLSASELPIGSHQVQ